MADKWAQYEEKVAAPAKDRWEQYAETSDPPAPAGPLPSSPPPPQPGFFSRAADMLNPLPMLAHPIETAKTIWNQPGIRANQAAEAFGRGNMAEGLGRSLQAIPLLGFAAEAGERMADDLRAGNYGGAAGTMTGLVAAPKLYSKVPAMVRGTSRTVRGLTRLDPEIASEQAFRPSPAEAEFPEVAPSAFSDVKKFGGEPPRSILGQPKVGAKQLAPGGHTTTAIETMQREGMDPWLDRARSINTQIAGDQIVSDVRASIPKLMWTKDPAGAQAIIDQAQQTWGGKQFTPDQFRDFLRTGNAGLARFYKQAPTAQQTAATAGTAPAISDAEISGIRNALYKALDPEGGGAGPRQIQERTGNVITLRNAAERRLNAIRAEKPVSQIGAVGRVLAAPFKLGAAPFRHNPTSIIGADLHPIIGRSDALIGGLYRQAPEAAPLPRPAPLATPRALLNGPTPRLNPPPDTSGIRVATGEPLTGRMITSGDIITPPPADTSGIRVTTGEPLRAPLNRQLPSPSMYPRGLSGQAGDVVDTVPVKRADGTIYYIPRHSAGRPLATPVQ